MNRKVLILIGILTVAAALNANALFRSSTGTTAFPMQKIGATAATVGMADITTTIQWGAGALAGNPALLLTSGRGAAVASYQLWFEDVKHEFVGGVYNLKNKSTIGLALNTLQYGTIEGYKADMSRTADVAARDIMFITGYAMPINDKLRAGATLKYMSQKIESEQNMAIAMDFGAFYWIPGEVWSVGAALKNLGASMAGSVQPISLTCGADYRFLKSKNLVAAGELELPIDNYPNIRIAAQYILKRMFYFSAGITSKFESTLSWANGLTFGLGVIKNNISFDIGLRPYGVISPIVGNTITTSIGYSF